MELTQAEYNAAYFGDDDERAGARHDAGYSNYLHLVTEKPYIKRPDRVFNAVSGRILELGCGVGTYAEMARSPTRTRRALDWTALDWSNWCKRHEVTLIIEQDALSYLQAQADNSFDYIVSFGFIECLADSDLGVMKTEMDRVAINQMHLTYVNPNSLFYNTSVKSRITEAIDLVEHKVKVTD